jgi:hypothetical protein
MGCGGYKPFRQEVDIELSPLTIFFGRNNSGKTALLRLPRLLLRSLSSRARGGFPLDVDDLSFGDSFRDLVHQRLVHGHIDLFVTLEDMEQRLSLNARVQNVFESVAGRNENREYQVVSRLATEDPPLVLQWDPRGGRPPVYEGQGLIEFRGLLPQARDLAGLPSGFFEDWAQRVQSFEDHLSHLSAHRRPIAGSYERSTPRPLGLDGSGAPDWIAESSELLEAVGDWYEKHMEGWRFALDISAGVYRCLLRRGSVEVNLADSGDGMQLLLPVVVQQLLHNESDALSFMDIIEEPELHLHPAAHAPLADLFLDTVKRGCGQILVETHSENLLLRLRRRIAEGADPKLVSLYWVEDLDDGSSIVRRIHILPNGEVDFWPEGIFSESYQEVRAMRRATRNLPGLEPTK